MSAVALAFALTCGLGDYIAAMVVVMRASTRCPASIPKHAWDAGAREAFPVARALPADKTK